MHESVVAGHFTVQPAGLVVSALRGSQPRGQTALRQGRIARKDEDQTVHLARRVALHPGGQSIRTQVGNVHALAGAIVGPAVVMALDFIAADDAQMQGHLAVGAAVFQGEHLAALAAIQHDGQLGKTAGESLARGQFVRPCQRVPVIGMRTHAAQIDRTSRTGRASRIRRANVDQIRTVFRHRGLQRAIPVCYLIVTFGDSPEKTSAPEGADANAICQELAMLRIYTSHRPGRTGRPRRPDPGCCTPIQHHRRRSASQPEAAN